MKKVSEIMAEQARKLGLIIGRNRDGEVTIFDARRKAIAALTAEKITFKNRKEKKHENT